MLTTDLKFFTNEPERTLYDRFNKILKTNTQYFDVIVGYFRTSGKKITDRTNKLFNDGKNHV